ncbi:MAG: hypothetical protein JO110_15255 [Acetobacteraceae bacterium]|nr:hypothetical protein [Acetobacteraceae bacterium]
MKGVARVAFLAHRDEIQVELDAGWPIKAVYERRAEKLGMSYQQFHRYVTAIIRGGQPAAPHIALPARHRPATQPTRFAPPSASTHQGSANAGQPSRRRKFKHDPSEKPDDFERLIGPGWDKK